MRKTIALLAALVSGCVTYQQKPKIELQISDRVMIPAERASEFYCATANLVCIPETGGRLSRLECHCVSAN